MRRLLRLALRGLLALVFVLALAGLGLFLALRPPRLSVPEPGFLLENVTLVEPMGARTPARRIAGQERIDSIETADGPVDGGFVLPGLIDLHVHHPPALAIGERSLFALLFLRHGVTTVRDTGTALPALLRRHASQIADGGLAGPRVRHCGPFLDAPPPNWPGALELSSPSEAREAVRKVAAQGHHCVKVYNELDSQTLAAVLDEARRVGLPVVAHVPWDAGLRELEGAEVQHLMGLPWTHEGVRRHKDLERYVAKSQTHRIRHTPTLVTFARLEALRGPNELVRLDPVSQLLPRYHRELLWNPERNEIVAGQLDTPLRFEIMREAVSALHEAGVPILVGTDTLNPLVVPGIALHEELALLVQAGLDPAEAWAAATWQAGEALGIPGLGRLEVGAPADLLVFDRDPTRDLANLASLRAVIAAGRLYPVDALDEALRRSRAHFEGPVYEPLSMFAASRGLDWLSSE